MENPRPLGVWFCATDEEVIEIFLWPRIQGNQHLNCGVVFFNVFLTEPYNLIHPQNVYYRPLHYWYFINRLDRGNGRPDWAIQTQPNQGSWKYRTRTVIKRGLLDIGVKEFADFQTHGKVNTGWKMEEFRLAVEGNLFQENGMVHIYYDAAEDKRPVALLDMDVEYGDIEIVL